MFTPTDALAGLKHHETLYDDFKREPLLPARLSQMGPGLAIGDVNGDGREDLFLSGARGSIGSLMLSGGRGTWKSPEDLFPPWNTDAECEQLGVLLFDADGDGDLDLFVVSGSDEAPAGDESYRSRLYLNDGKGGFTHAAPDQVPDLHDSGSVAAAADYDRDGDLDLFVGGRCVPGQYPLTPHSRLLQNDHGTFRDVTERDAPALLDAGMVTSAVWSDVNGDGWIDLLVTTEWGPIKVFINHEGKLVDETEAAGLANLRGWWNGIAARDLDGDGDIDFVVTNMGRNTPYRVSPDRPARIVYGDFNGDGKPVMVEGTYDEEGRLVPMRSKLEAQLALPFVEAAFPTFHEYASATLADVLGQKALDQALSSHRQHRRQRRVAQRWPRTFHRRAAAHPGPDCARLWRRPLRLQCRRNHRRIHRAKFLCAASRSRAIRWRSVAVALRQGRRQLRSCSPRRKRPHRAGRRQKRGRHRSQWRRLARSRGGRE